MTTKKTGRRSAGWTYRSRFDDWAHDLIHTDSQPTGRRRDAEDVTA